MVTKKKVVKKKVKTIKLTPSEIFEQQVKDNGLNDLNDYVFTKEYKFHETRKWRFDYVWLPKNNFELTRRPLAVEIMGGIWTGGGHVTGTGYEKDCEKLNHAILEGYRVMYLTSKMVRDGSTGINYVKQALGAE